MYSIVLMMAINGTADTPDFLFRRRARGGGGDCQGCTGCTGCHGCTGCCGGCGGCTGGHGCTGGMMKPAEKIGAPKGAALAPAPATMVVSLPEDATLLVNNTPTTSTTARRVFVSPPLPPGRDYMYTLRAEVVRDGQKMTTTRQVIVRAGQESRVEMELPVLAAAGQ
jgi:uncharacterized protein (TIGR03000 family)